MTDSVIMPYPELQPALYPRRTAATHAAIAFLDALVLRFAAQRDALLAGRQQRQQSYDQSYLPDLDMETASIRASE